MDSSGPNFRPLTKSQFKLGLACLQKLRHHRDGLRSALADDDLMRLLAEGGAAVEALQRAVEPAFWVGPDGTDDAEVLSRAAMAKAASEVSRDGDRRSLYEFTIGLDGFLARIDLLRIHRDRLELVEIKSKSWTGPQPGQPLADILSKDGSKILADWVPYLQDLAFQADLLRRWLVRHGPDVGLPPDFPVVPKLKLAKAGGVATAADCLTAFRTEQETRGGRRRTRVRFNGTLRSTRLLVEAEAATAISLMDLDAQSKVAVFAGLGIAACMERMLAIVRSGEWPAAAESLGRLCQACEYTLPAEGGSGKVRCWGGDVDAVFGHVLRLPWRTDHQVRTAIQRSQGGPLMATLRHLHPDDLQRRQQRPWEIAAMVGNRVSEALARDRFGVLQAPPAVPVYVLDFEAARYPIPYRAGGTVNELVPFQFEAHALPHREAPLTERRLLAGFLDLGTPDPRRGLVRALRDQFGSEGPIYHWSTYEDQVITAVAASLQADVAPQAGDEDLIARCHALLARLVDLCEIARNHLILPQAQGSYSLKQVLPVIWQDAETRRAFGPGQAPGDPSHYDDPEDPYQTLPRLDRESLGGLDEEVVQAWAAGQEADSGAIANGGLAMVRYHQVRLFGGHDHPDIQRQFRQYCQLDSAATLMAYDFLRRTG